jgi:hypothetical protein
LYNLPQDTTSSSGVKSSRSRNLGIAMEIGRSLELDPFCHPHVDMQEKESVNEGEFTIITRRIPNRVEPMGRPL